MKFFMSIVGNDESALICKINFPSESWVKIGDVILEVETSKTVIEIRAECEGQLLHALSVGKTLHQGDPLFQILPKTSLTDEIEKNISLLNSEVKVKSKELELSKRKHSEIRNLLSMEHGSSTSILTILIDLPGERIVPAPFIFKGGISDILVFEAAKLLLKYKDLNAYYKGDGYCEMYDEVNFGWGFDSGDNLKVLTLRNAQSLSLTELQDSVFDLLKAYEFEEKLPVDLVIGSTVTFSDLSRTEVDIIIPLINGKQSLILGLTRPNKNLFRIVAAYDHRVSAGMTVANFLSELKGRILSHYFGINAVVSLVCYACEKTMAEEIALYYRGFIKITLPNGEDAHLCHNCFNE